MSQPNTPYAEVIGAPIGHSLSPAIHKFWLADCSIKADYRAQEVLPEALEAYLKQRQQDPLWLGCNVTLPHKVTVMNHVDVSPHVKTQIGAVNTVCWTNEKTLQGYNTDVAGFFEPLKPFDLKGCGVVLIGAGGASRAILYALKRAGVGHVTILARNTGAAQQLLAAYQLDGQARALDAPLPPAHLLVNASPLGMAGQPALTLDLAGLHPNATVYDIVYKPLETDLLRQARQRKLKTIDGLSMLIGQAAVAFEHFFGCPAPRARDAHLRAQISP